VSPEEIEALRRELHIQKTLRHENIVKLYNAFEEKGYLYIVLEYVEKGTLFDSIQARTLSEDDVVNIFFQVVSAIAYLHNRNILHRDIKPENVLMKNKSYAKLCDFGFSAPYGTDIIRYSN